jgi:hypothetical protein
VAWPLSVAVVVLPASATGTLNVEVADPWAHLGFDLMFQIWVVDPGATSSRSATNGLLLHEP